jgi:hypothetical protein
MLRRGWPALRRVPSLPAAVRLGGAAEFALAVAAVVAVTRITAALLALVYAMFAVVAVRLMVRRQSGSCGCFGRTESPVGAPHVVLNLAATGIALAAVIDPAGALGGLTDQSIARAVVGIGQAGLLAYLGFLSITALPALAAARRQVAA